MSDPLPGKGLFGWLGRQVGHVKKAIQTDPAAPQVSYRNETVEEVEHPQQPGVKLRRTTIDEVIVFEDKSQKLEAAGANPETRSQEEESSPDARTDGALKTGHDPQEH